MAQIENIDSQTLKGWMYRNEVVLIDVREVEEYEVAAIEGAVFMPLGKLSPDSIPQNPDKKIVFHCKVGGRSMRACQLAADSMPHETIYNLDQGIDGWVAQGLPVKVA